ncbi:hypothetical protein ACFOMD_14255 [Sphingoaurantiacus capsulatus]|uniref:Methyltransferase n=1 Tax=Sphingoaurantiacus capsulatus TaxID=1771310 RepID=A0ABV7XE43_9SPHN
MGSHFDSLTPQRVSALRKQDPAVAAIDQLTRDGRRISFDWLRQTFGAQNGTQHQLDRGRAILPSKECLDQYLYSHGLMIQSQWEKTCSAMPLGKEPFRFIDYGCGQGLAGILLFDHYGAAFRQAVKQVVLVEPSEVALIRAEAVYRSLIPAAPIFCVGKPFQKLAAKHLQPDSEVRTVHVFSNVMDITGFDQVALLRTGLTEGKHTVIVISHDRDHDGGSARIEKLRSSIAGTWNGLAATVRKSKVVRFECDNPSRSKAIRWFLKVDIARVESV